MHSLAAVASLVIICMLSVKNYSGGFVQEEYHLIQTIPYILVLAGGIIGLNVFLVLITGIVSGSIIMIATGMIVPTDLLGNMGDGAAGMFETSMVALLVAAICALIKEYGGFAALLYWIKKVFKGRKGGLLGMGLLVGLMDIATANNTVGQSLWPIRLRRKCQEITESAIRKLHLSWIRFPVFSRESFPMEHRCSLRSQLQQDLVKRSMHLIFYRCCFILICYCLVRLSLFLLKKTHDHRFLMRRNG